MTLRKKTSANTVTENVSCPPPTIEPPSSEKLDFRDPDDDAWYTISIRLENAGDILEGVDEGLHLRLMFIDFTDMEDKRYGLENFEDVNDLDEFAKRFRVVWPQLQDSECWKVVEGLEVCSSYQFEKEVFLKFYNAIVKSVSVRFFLN
ncbi:hypothetical protein ZOSMA_340G00210 [Zostera marina]|uniref:SAWADEE domain-containing protein n=1 Tax=Zostera marina TaxID=29655 RepID=A0A0K9P7I4_ZOSMR|nr:hypothetical protein ZOSMA_340G00210 [Zostera marina]